MAGISDQERRRRARLEANRLRRRVTPTPKHCAVCRKPFTPKRRDAKTCGAACRQTLHRAGREG